MNQYYDVIVIGGGASGMMAAGRAALRGRKVLLLEKNEELGRKLAITGGGRCNICSVEDDIHRLLSHYGSAAKFLHSSFYQFGVAATFDFFAAHDVPLKVEANQRAFPKTEKATDVVKALETFLRQGKVEIRTETEVHGFAAADGKVTSVRVKDELLTAESYILATGGKSHPGTGSTGDGFHWLSELGLEVQEPTPTVVPLAVSETWIKSLSGISLDNIKITFYVDGDKQFVLKGRILCTHFGVSGPLILNAAKKVADLLRTGVVTATIDVFPQFDPGALDKHLTKIFEQNTNRELKNIMKLITPTGTAAAILTLLPQLDPEKRVHSITRAERRAVVNRLKALPITITRLMGHGRAIVTDGGLAISEVDGKTMRLRKLDNLFVTGDLLNINRPSGGYSLQLCWTTGWVAGSNS